MILLMLFSAEGKQTSFTSQPENIIKVNKMILLSRKELKDNKLKKPLAAIIFQRCLLKTKACSVNCMD